MSNDIPAVEWVIEITKKAGEKIQEVFFKDKHATFKLSSSDLLTETDILIEKFLTEQINQKYPDHLLLCEESSCKTSILTDEPTWVIDPIDGTANFVHSLPFVAISIGFTLNKIPYLGVIHNPIMNETFYATRGNGAYLLTGSNSNPINLHVAPVRLPNHSIIATEFSSSIIHRGLDEESRRHLSDAEIARCAELKEISLKNARRLLEGCRDIRRLGSCATELAFIAAGRLDGLCELCVKEWDICAGCLIIEEAGGYIADYEGNYLTDIGKRQIIAGSNKELCKSIATLCLTPTFNLRDLEQ